MDCSSAGKDAGAVTECNAGHYSTLTQNSCTEAEWIYSTDTGGASCPSESTKTTDRWYCELAGADQGATSSASASTCSAGEEAWYGTACSACAFPWATWGVSQCKTQKARNAVFCDPGDRVDSGACLTDDQ